MELVPLTPDYDGRDNDISNIQQHCSDVAFSDSDSSVVLDIDTVTELLKKMLEWLRHVRWVSSVMGLDWTVDGHYQSYLW